MLGPGGCSATRWQMFVDAVCLSTRVLRLVSRQTCETEMIKAKCKVASQNKPANQNLTAMHVVCFLRGSICKNNVVMCEHFGSFRIPVTTMGQLCSTECDKRSMTFGAPRTLANVWRGLGSLGQLVTTVIHGNVVRCWWTAELTLMASTHARQSCARSSAVLLWAYLFRERLGTALLYGILSKVCFRTRKPRYCRLPMCGKYMLT